MTRVDFASKWDAFLTVIESVPGVNSLLNTASVIGLLIAVYAVFKIFWAKAGRGDLSNQTGGTGGGWGLDLPTWTTATLFICAVLTAPRILGVFLTALQGVVNAVIQIFGGA